MYDSEYMSSARYINTNETTRHFSKFVKYDRGNILVERTSSGIEGTLFPATDTSFPMLTAAWVTINTRKAMVNTQRTGLNI